MPCSKLLLLQIVDVVNSCIIVFPLSALYWSSTWKLLDIYVYPRQHVTSAGLCLSVGGFTMLLLYYLYPALGAALSRSTQGSSETSAAEGGVRHIVASRILIYVSSLAQLLFWRGAWMFGEKALGSGLTNNGIALVVTLALLILVRGTANGVAAPFSICVDTPDDFYVPSPRFRHNVSSLIWYSADVLFSVLFVGSLIVILWVSLWAVGDALLWPNDLLFSYIVCIAMAFGLTLVLYLAQTPTRLAAAALYGKSRCLGHAFSVAFNVAVTVVVLLAWRGSWGLMRDFVLVDNKPGVVTSAWLIHATSMAAMLGLRVSGTVAELGCAVDGEGTDGGDVVFRVDYLAAWWRARQQRTQATAPNSADTQEPEIDECSPLLTDRGTSSRPYSIQESA